MPAPKFTTVPPLSKCRGFVHPVTQIDSRLFRQAQYRLQRLKDERDAGASALWLWSCWALAHAAKLEHHTSSHPALNLYRFGVLGICGATGHTYDVADMEHPCFFGGSGLNIASEIDVRVMALELGALLAEDGWTAADFAEPTHIYSNTSSV